MSKYKTNHLLLSFVCIIFLATSFSQAQIPYDTNKYLETLTSQSVKPIQRRWQIPRRMKKQLRKRFGDFRIANPNKKYRKNDVVLNPFLPDKQLIFGGKMKGKSFLVFWKGGRGRSLFFAYYDAAIDVLELFYIDAKVNTLDELIQAVENGSLDPYYY